MSDLPHIPEWVKELRASQPDDDALYPAIVSELENTESPGRADWARVMADWCQGWPVRLHSDRVSQLIARLEADGAKTPTHTVSTLVNYAKDWRVGKIKGSPMREILDARRATA